MGIAPSHPRATCPSPRPPGPTSPNPRRGCHQKSRVAIVLRALWPDVLVGIMKSRYLKEAPKLQEAASTAAGADRDES